MAVPASPIKNDEEVIFFPSPAHRSTGGVQGWDCEIQGWIFELEKRQFFLKTFARYLDLDLDKMSPAEREIFDHRTRLFVADNQSSKLLSIRVGSQIQRLQKSRDNGHLTGRFHIAESNSFTQTVPTNSGQIPQIAYGAVTRPGDARKFEGTVFLVPDEGWSVISDIDDTIKISKVGQKKELLLNTFTRPFVPIPGMAQVYQQWMSQTNCVFHYVSGSPWQIYPALTEFLRIHHFPEGSFHLRQFDWRETISHKFYDPVGHKDSVLKPLLRKFPKRRFILVGDSGERDPEIYGSLAREFPAQVMKILILDPDQKMDSTRCLAAFDKLAPARLQVFTNATELLNLSMP